MDRLFVPLSSEPYEWFKLGQKKYELRKYGRQYTEKHVYSGRLVELRKGYSGESLWGTVGDVFIGEIGVIFSSVKDYRKIIPPAKDLEDAIKRVKGIMGEGEDYIAFEVILKT